MTHFAFATCLPGLEPALKREVARTRPELRFAYSRPGLVTFKSPTAVSPEDAPGSVFARVWGRSVGAARDPDAAARQLAPLGATRVHVFARQPEEEVAPAGGDASRRPAATAGGDGRLEIARYRSALPGLLDGEAAPGELVADVVVAAGEPAWLGLHRHDATRLPCPGGQLQASVPADAPSRAYAKIEEAIAWQRLPVAAGQVAVEIGAAPGGAVMALARRGLEVWGVDTGELAPVVRALPGVHHLPVKVGGLRWEQLPPHVDWLLVDVNLAPQVALHEIARLMPRLRPTLRGAVFTLKVNDWEVVDALPTLVERILRFGFSEVSVRHLPSNRREVCAVAR